MKLNLLPTHVSRGTSTRTALIFSILIVVVCALGALYLYQQAGKDLSDSQADIPQMRAKADEALQTSNAADELMNAPSTTMLLRNTSLAQEMLKHSTRYPDIYDKVKSYVPTFYRVTSLVASSAGPGVVNIQMVGVLDTYQQYADLMLALLRIPGVQSVSRAGFVNESPFVPGLNEQDQLGRPHKPGETPIPDDPLQRLDYLQQHAGVTGFTGTGGFGTGVKGLRGPMPHASQVTVNLVMAGDLQVPDPTATLTGAGGGAATGPSTTPRPGGQTAPARGDDASSGREG